nr:hypothetical protein Iba_chr06aCG16790 [Ipomoea batatas]
MRRTNCFLVFGGPIVHKPSCHRLSYQVTVCISGFLQLQLMQRQLTAVSPFFTIQGLAPLNSSYLLPNMLRTPELQWDEGRRYDDEFSPSVAPRFWRPRNSVSQFSRNRWRYALDAAKSSNARHAKRCLSRHGRSCSSRDAGS